MYKYMCNHMHYAGAGAGALLLAQSQSHIPGGKKNHTNDSHRRLC
jgi:hypothetical protein